MKMLIGFTDETTCKEVALHYEYRIKKLESFINIARANKRHHKKEGLEYLYDILLPDVTDIIETIKKEYAYIVKMAEFYDEETE